MNEQRPCIEISSVVSQSGFQKSYTLESMDAKQYRAGRDSIESVRITCNKSSLKMGSMYSHGENPGIQTSASRNLTR